jgi:hypothetical protein
MQLMPDSIVPRRISQRKTDTLTQSTPASQRTTPLPNSLMGAMMSYTSMILDPPGKTRRDSMQLSCFPPTIPDIGYNPGIANS